MLPLVQVLVVLVNSILLVCISIDRYMALLRIVKVSWEPSKQLSVTCCVMVWGFAIAVSSSQLDVYDFYTVYVVPLPDPHEEDPILTFYVAHLCGSDKVQLNLLKNTFPISPFAHLQARNRYYFFMIFSFIFGPLIVTILWLIAVLVKKVWKKHINVETIASKKKTLRQSRQ